MVGTPFVEKIIQGAKSDFINTDNRTLIEFAFARNLGKDQIFSPDLIRDTGREINAHRPKIKDGWVDWQLVEENSMHTFPLVGQEIPLFNDKEGGDRQQRALAFNQYLQGNMAAAYDAWIRQSRLPEYPLELIMVAESSAEAGMQTSLELIGKLNAFWPTAGDAILARFYWRRGEGNQALSRLTDFFSKIRTDPWVPEIVIDHALDLANEMSWERPEIARKLHDALAEPFSVYILNQKRMDIRLEISSWLMPQYAVSSLYEYEPYPYWTYEFLYYRHQYYKAVKDPLTEKARHQLSIYLSHSSKSFL